MLKELTHMDRITQLQDEIEQVLASPRPGESLMTNTSPSSSLSCRTASSTSPLGRIFFKSAQQFLLQSRGTQRSMMLQRFWKVRLLRLGSVLTHPNHRQ